jgi:Ca2+-binding RTX toxin-like protein
VGTAADDTLYGTASAEKISGGAGNDWIDGKAGNDTLTGGAGYDTFVLSPGGGQKTVTDFNAGDHVYVKAFGATAPSIVQSGADTVIKYATGESMTLKNVQASTLAHSTDGAWLNGTVNQSTTTAETPSTTTPTTSTPTTSATLTGTSGYDALVGTSASETLNAMAGNDWVEGKGGNDVLTGGAGYDQFAFGLGNGHDVVTDFDTTMDKLYIGGQVKAGHVPTITQSGADTLVTFSASDSVLLKNVDMHSLSHSSDWNYIM